MEVPNYSFIPEPEVTSEVIKMKLREKTAVDIENPKVMFMIIKSAFMQKSALALGEEIVYNTAAAGNRIPATDT